MLLADVLVGDKVRHGFHGEAVGGECLLTLEQDSPLVVVRQARVPRETVKGTIRAWRDELLPGTTLVFAYAGADPWPLYTQAGTPHPAADLLGEDERQ